MVLSCPGCQVELPTWLIRTRQADSTCPNCYRKLRVELFPAAFRKRETVGGAAAVVVENEAACYEHPGKPAKSVCHRCGRFVCALCEVEMSGEIWCPGCLQAPQGGTAPDALATERTNYDSIALALATWPIAGLIYLSLFTGPAALYVAIRYWRKPLSLVPRTRWRFVVAIVVGVLEIVALGAAIYAFIFAIQRQGIRR